MVCISAHHIEGSVLDFMYLKKCLGLRARQKAQLDFKKLAHSFFKLLFGPGPGLSPDSFYLYSSKGKNEKKILSEFFFILLQ